MYCENEKQKALASNEVTNVQVTPALSWNHQTTQCHMTATI